MTRRGTALRFGDSSMRYRASQPIDRGVGSRKLDRAITAGISGRSQAGIVAISSAHASNSKARRNRHRFGVRSLQWKSCPTAQSPEVRCWNTSATAEKTVFAFPLIRRTVPMTTARIRTSRIAYSAMSCPSSDDQISSIARAIVQPLYVAGSIGAG